MGRAKREHDGDLGDDEALSLARSSPRAAELIVRAATLTGREVEFRATVEAILDLAVTDLGADVAHLTSVMDDESLRLEGHRNLEASRLELDLRPVALDQSIDEILQRIGVQLHERRVHVRATGPLPQVLTDSLRLEQILGNLISNAVKYGYPGSDIDVELTRFENAVRVSVINRGAGIAQSELPTLFERFQRTEGARVSGVPGVGLGLYITRGLVEANGGQIWAESEPGGLTAFRFTLPIAKGTTRQSQPHRAERESIH